VPVSEFKTLSRRKFHGAEEARARDLGRVPLFIFPIAIFHFWQKNKEAALVQPPLLPGVCSMSALSLSYLSNKYIRETLYR